VRWCCLLVIVTIKLSVFNLALYFVTLYDYIWNKRCLCNWCVSTVRLITTQVYYMVWRGLCNTAHSFVITKLSSHYQHHVCECRTSFSQLSQWNCIFRPKVQDLPSLLKNSSKKLVNKHLIFLKNGCIRSNSRKGIVLNFNSRVNLLLDCNLTWDVCYHHATFHANCFVVIFVIMRDCLVTYSL